MKFWKFLTPRMLGFSMRTVSQFVVDKFRGAPTRPVQVAQYVARNARAGDPKDVLRTMDRFAREERWLMNIGPHKGPLIQELAERLPNDARILELGAYCGYSSIMLASTFGEKSRIVSIEIDENSVRASRANVEFAGLANQITFIHGPSTKMIPRNGTHSAIPSLVPQRIHGSRRIQRLQLRVLRKQFTLSTPSSQSRR